MNDDELNIKFKQIAQMFGKENVNIPDNLGSILSMLANSTPKEQVSTNREERSSTYEKKETKEEPTAKSNLNENTETIRKIAKIMNSIETSDDPRVNLLIAMSPFLNQSRQKKVENCIKLFQMTQLTSTITETEKKS